MYNYDPNGTYKTSPPTREAWIEIESASPMANPLRSPPTREAWIEIKKIEKYRTETVSRLPPGRRGLKYQSIRIRLNFTRVASHPGGVD